ncbi:MAG: hypothetical protein J5702_07000 [Bacteroidales bacterium]|nr:hypothetical protein [Bacteroidales bacterium]
MKKSVKRILYLISGIILLSGVFASCEQAYKVTIYRLTCGATEYTGPGDIADPNLEAVYIRLLDDLMNDLSLLRLDEMWTVNIYDDNFKEQDEKRVAQFNKYLPKVKELEATYKKRIEEIEITSTSSFCIKLQYILSRSVPADYASALCLQEYSFELKYN